MMVALTWTALAVAAALASTLSPPDAARMPGRWLAAGALLLPVAGWTGLLALLALAVVGPPVWRAVGERRRRAAVRDAFPDDLKAIAASMRGGRALADALRDAASPWWNGPATAVGAGSPPGACVRQFGAAAGIPACDLGWTSTLDELARREVPLASFLEATAARLGSRREARRNLHVATSQARGQAVLLTAIPPLLVLVYFLLDPRFRERAPESPVFWGVLALLAGLDGVAWLWIRRLLVPPR